MYDSPHFAKNYTQNIDTLETVVGVRNVLQCHGSFATASCLECRIRVPGRVIEEEIMRGEVPLCKSCSHSRIVPRKGSNTVQKRRKKSDSDDEDAPLFPPWIMKVIASLILGSLFCSECQLAGYHVLW